MLKMSNIGRNARVQMFAKIVDRCLWQSAVFIMSTNMLDMTWLQH